MGNTTQSPSGSLQSPSGSSSGKNKFRKAKTRKLLFSQKNSSERPPSGKAANASGSHFASPSGGPASGGSALDLIADSMIPDDELEALKLSCLSHIEQLVFIIKERKEDEDPEEVFALLKQCIGNARKQLGKYQESTVARHERPQTAKSDANYDWGDINIDGIDSIPLPDDAAEGAGANGSTGASTLFPPGRDGTNAQDSPLDVSRSNTDDLSFDATGSSGISSSNLLSGNSHKSSSASDGIDAHIDWMGSLILTSDGTNGSKFGPLKRLGRDGKPRSGSDSEVETKTESVGNVENAENVENGENGVQNEQSSEQNSGEVRKASDENANEKEKENGIENGQDPLELIENICMFLTVAERFRWGVCSKRMNEICGSGSYSFSKQFQMDNIFWAQHFDQFYNEQNDSLEIWNGMFHKLSSNEIDQLKYFIIYYHMFNDTKKITNFKAIIPSDLETLVISGNKPKNEQQRRRLARFIGHVVGFEDKENVIDWLYLESNFFIDEDIQCISRGMMRRAHTSNLCLISLNDNTHITDKCIPVLLEAIGQKGRKLQFLQLSNCKRLTNATCEAIVNFYVKFSKSTKLHEINLSKNRRINERGINLLDRLIKSKKNLPKNDNFVLFKVIVTGCGFKKRKEHWEQQLEG